MQSILKQIQSKEYIQISNDDQDVIEQNNFIEIKYHQKESSLKIFSLSLDKENENEKIVSQEKLIKTKNILESLSQFNTKGIVQIYEEFIIETNYFIITERLEQSLKSWLQSTQQKEKIQLVDIAIQILEIAQYFHSINSQFCEISLENLYFTSNQTVKLFYIGDLQELKLQEKCPSNQLKNSLIGLPENETDIQNVEVCLSLLFGSSFSDIIDFIKQENTLILTDPQINSILSKAFTLISDERPSYEDLLNQFKDLQQQLQMEENQSKILLPSNQKFEQVKELFLKEQFSESLILLKELESEFPENDMYKAWIGRIYFALEDMEESLLYSNKSLQINPYNYVAFFNLGNIESEQKNTDKAIDYYNQSLQIFPTNYSALFNLALEQQFKQNYQEAICKYKLALIHNSNKDQAIYNLGYCYLENNEIENAIFYLKNAVKLNPKKDIAYFQLGVAYSKKFMYNESINYYLKSLELDNKCDITLFNIGNTYLDQNMFPQSIYYYKKSLRMNKKKHSAYNNIGYIYMQKQIYEKSIKNFKKAFETGEEQIYFVNYIDSKSKI